MSKVTDPRLLEQLESSIPTGGKVTDPNLIQELEKPETKSIARNVVETAADFGSNVAGGLKDTGVEIGRLAGDILEYFNATKGLGKDINESLKDVSEGIPAEDFERSPIASSIGRGIGYTAGYVVGPNKAVGAPTGVAKAVIPGVKALAEKFPIIGGAMRGGAEGAVGGAAMQPEERGLGGFVGAGVGVPFGAAGSAVREGMRGALSFMQPAYDRAAKLGLTPEATNVSVRRSLADKGVGDLKDEIIQKGQEAAQSEVTKINPYPDSPNSPVQKISKNINETRSATDAAVEAAYEPLISNPSTILVVRPPMSKVARNYLPNGTVASRKINTQAEIDKLADKGLNPREATFQDLKEYRTMLSSKIEGAKKSLKGTRDLDQLIAFRKQLTDQMKVLADKAGLSKEFNSAEKLFIEKKLPLMKISMDNNPDETVNYVKSMLNSSNPDVREIKRTITALGGGPEGKKKMGWAVLQIAMDGAQQGDNFSITQLNRIVNRYAKLGLDKYFTNVDYRTAVKAVNKIAQETKQAAQVKAYRWSAPIIKPLIMSLMESEKGMALIRFIGSNKSPQRQVSAAIHQLMMQSTNMLGQGIIDRTTKKERSVGVVK